MKLLSKARDRSVRASELFENAASGSIRERGERSIEHILNHLVQYITADWRLARGLSARFAACCLHSQIDTRHNFGRNYSPQPDVESNPGAGKSEREGVKVNPSGWSIKAFRWQLDGKRATRGCALSRSVRIAGHIA